MPPADAGTPRPDTWAPPAPDSRPAWPAPPDSGEDSQDLVEPPASARRRLPTAIKVLLIGGVAAAILIAALWLSGGFKLRNTYTDHKAGERISLGPIAISLRQAVSYVFVDNPVVEVSASCQLTATDSTGTIHFAMQEASLAGARIAGKAVISTGTRMSLGVAEDRLLTTRAAISPDLKPMPCVFRYEFPAGTKLENTITFLIQDLEWIEATNVRNDSDAAKTWESANTGHRVILPLTHIKR